MTKSEVERPEQVLACGNCNFQGYPADCHVRYPGLESDELVCPDCGSTEIRKFLP